MWVCSRVTGKIWGINSRLAHWIYKAILLPKVLYSSVVWRPMVSTQAARLIVYRLKCQGEWRDTRLDNTKLEFLRKYPVTLNQNRILKKYQLVKPFKIWTPSRKDWQKPDKITEAQCGPLFHPYISIGKAYLWAAFPRCFLPK
jgi:hypothetical protein